MKRAKSLTEAAKLIENLESFGSRNVAVWALDGWNGARGWMPTKEIPEDLHRATYVVYSYGTPIGYVTEDGRKIVPDIGYSATTAQHQYLVLNAWKIKGQFPKRGRPVVRAGGGARRGGIDDL